MVKVKKKGLNEAETQNLESMIPELAAGATHTAYVKALAAGHTVVRTQGSQIVATSADGQVKVIGTAKPLHKVKKGQSFKIRSDQLHVGA